MSGQSTHGGEVSSYPDDRNRRNKLERIRDTSFAALGGAALVALMLYAPRCVDNVTAQGFPEGHNSVAAEGDENIPEQPTGSPNLQTTASETGASIIDDDFLLPNPDNTLLFESDTPGYTEQYNRAPGREYIRQEDLIAFDLFGMSEDGLSRQPQTYYANPELFEAWRNNDEALLLVSDYMSYFNEEHTGPSQSEIDDLSELIINKYPDCLHGDLASEPGAWYGILANSLEYPELIQRANRIFPDLPKGISADPELLSSIQHNESWSNLVLGEGKYDTYAVTTYDTPNGPVLVFGILIKSNEYMSVALGAYRLES